MNVPQPSASEHVSESDVYQQFADFSLPSILLESLAEQELITPTPIQKLAIPALLERKDMVGLAQTGTGKTAAFLLPLLTHLSDEPPVHKNQPPLALILAPTRELALQVLENVRSFTKHMNIRSVAVYGGARYDGQINGLRRGAEIVVATPGRLEDLIKRGAVSLEAIRYFILDEADHMLDLGFHPAMMRISAQIPKDRQTMLFSATMPPEIRKLSDHFLTDPVHVEAPQNLAKAHHIAQHVYLVAEKQKRGLLIDILNQKAVESCVIFVRTKRRADTLAANLSEIGLKVDALHGDMRQFLRRKVLDKFRAGQINILIATDVAARGIDIPAISHVINYDMPESQDAYTHRIGRTGRAGMTGIALSLCNDTDALKLRQILAKYGDDIALTDADGNAVSDHAIAYKPAGRASRSRGRKQSNSSNSNRPSRQKTGKASGKPAGKPAGKAPGKAEGKTKARSFDKPARKSFDKWADKPSDKWSDKAASEQPPRRKKKSAPAASGKSYDKPYAKKPKPSHANADDKAFDSKPFHAKPKSNKPHAKSGSKPYAKSGSKPYVKSGAKSGAKFNGKPHAKSGAKSHAKSGKGFKGGGNAPLKRKSRSA